MKNLFNWQQDLGDTLVIRVTPRAASNRIKVEQKDDGTSLIRVYVTTVSEDGKANKAVIELLAKELDLPKSSLQIVQGLTSKDKIVRIVRT
jgi:uncharacterized protein YggU (UPF0235/DUF167 family)